MPRFPIKEAEILRLARQMIAGFKKHAQDLPAPFVPVEQMERELGAAEAGLLKKVEADAAAKEATVDKDRRFKTLSKTMAVNLRYAEIRSRKNPRLLHAVGWGSRRPKRPIQAPGEVRALRIVEQMETALVLRWRKPVDGGRVAAYRIQRQRLGVEGWKVVGTSMKTEVTLDQQERGVEYEYRVVAFNKAGEGPPSSTVQAVL